MSRQLANGRSAILLTVLLALGSCGDGRSEASDAAPDVTAPGYRVGGTAAGLEGAVNLVLNGSELVTVSADGDFEFTSELEDGDSYLVTILGQPEQDCSITNGSGAIAASNVSDVAVSCTHAVGGFTVGGTVTGLSGDLNLVLNGSELVTVSADADFEFTGELEDGDSYFVTLLGQPEGQDCSIANGSGVIVGADVSVAVSCTNVVGGFTVGGSVIGLAGDLNLVLNGTELISVSSDGDFVFSTLLPADGAYLVTLAGKPIAQTCTLENASGTVGIANIEDVNVACVVSTANLTSLEFVGGDVGLTPSFDPELFSYTAGVSVAVAELAILPTAADPSATIRVNGILVASNTPTTPIDLELGINSINIEITTANGDSRSYGIELTRGIDVLEQVAHVKASNTQSNDQFGWSVAMAGDTLAVGTIFESSNAVGVDGDQTDNTAGNSGAVYVFRRTGANWAQEAYLKASNPDLNDQFGGSIALSGDTLAVGAEYEGGNATGVNGDQTDNSASRSGAVYVFRRSGSTWAQEAYLKASNTDADDQFGASVALSGDSLAVGAFFEDSNATGVNGDQAGNTASDSGAAYVFRRNGSTWAQEAYLKASNTDANDQFGISVALSGDTVAVGAPFENSNATGVNGDQADNTAGFSGAVYVFERAGTIWTQEAYLKASNTDDIDLFGSSITLSVDTLAVGAPFEDSNATGVGGVQTDNTASECGAVYVFRRSPTTWSQEAYLKASNADAGDRFGNAIGLSGDVLAVGANTEDSDAAGVGGDQTNNSATQSGAAYVFRRTGDIWSQEAYLKASNAAATRLFGSSIAVSADGLAVGAVLESSNSTGVNGDETNTSASASGAVYLFQ
jgi:hypothetical protein